MMWYRVQIEYSLVDLSMTTNSLEYSDENYNRIKKIKEWVVTSWDATGLTPH